MNQIQMLRSRLHTVMSKGKEDQSPKKEPLIIEQELKRTTDPLILSTVKKHPAKNRKLLNITETSPEPEKLLSGFESR